MNRERTQKFPLRVFNVSHRYPVKTGRATGCSGPTSTSTSIPQTTPTPTSTPAQFALQQVAVDCQPSTITGILGPNGSGKSTLLRIMGGLERPSCGHVLVNGRDLATIKTRELATMIAFFPQDTTRNLPLTVGQLVLLGREPLREHKRGWFDTSEDIQAATSAMERAGITHLANRPLSTLSGGEMQRAWLAKMLAQAPRILLLDEPVNHLDIGSQIEILDLVVQTAHASSITVIMVLHDLNLAAQYCDQIILLGGGQKIASGTPEQVLTPPILEKLYRVRLASNNSADDHDGVMSFIPVSMEAKKKRKLKIKAERDTNDTSSKNA